MNLVLSFLITFISYTIYPFIKFKIMFKNKSYTDKIINKSLLLNSIVVAIIYIILSYLLHGENVEINLLPALFYYFINQLLFSRKNNNLNLKNENKIAVIIVIVGIIFFALCFIIGSIVIK